jgi:anaerobic magnesium-protoporphyrin IX monomethyl ester cyclase
MAFAKKKFLMVSPMFDFGPFLPINISIIIAVLEQANYEVKLFDTTFYRIPKKSQKFQDIDTSVGMFKPVNWDGYGMDDLKDDYIGDFNNLIKSFQPDFIGVSIFTTFNENLANSLINAIGSDYPGHVIVGGMHSYINLDRVKSNKRVDAIINGESEHCIIDALGFLSGESTLTLNEIANLHVCNPAGEWESSNKKGITNLEVQPFLNWNHFDERNFYRPFDGKILRMGHVEMARGCPFKCTYCINEFFHEHYPNSKPYKISKTKTDKGYWRLKTVKRFLEEVDYLQKKHNLNAIKIWDDDFLAMGMDTVQEVTQGIYKMGLKFLCHSRPEHMNNDKMKILGENGCIQIGVGVECGSPTYREKMLGRKMQDSTVINAFANCRKHGIIASAFCMIGMPDETREDILMTARLLREANPHVIVSAIFTPYEGNSLYEYAKKRGYIDDNIDYEDFWSCFLNMPSIPKEDVENMYRVFRFYCRLDDSFYPKIELAEKDDSLLCELVAELKNTKNHG